MLAQMHEMKITWEILLDDYFFAHHLRPATEWSYRKVVRVFINFIGSERLPEDIQHRDILLWRRYLLKDKQQSAQTWNNKIAHLRALFNYGMEQGWLHFDKNPFNHCVVQKEKKKKRTLDKSQLIRIYLIMQQLEEQEHHLPLGTRCAFFPVYFWLAVLDTLRYTGMRLNQLLHIQLRDVNVDEGYIELRLAGSKTHREWRVPIVRQLRMRLRLLLIRVKEAGATPTDLLFDVDRLRAANSFEYVGCNVEDALQKIRSFFRRLSKECGFWVSPHRFRHTLATELMKAPERNLQLVKDLLGHTSINTTLEYVELKMDIASQTLERELALYTDICVEKDLPRLTK